MALIQCFIDICLFRRGPQDVPLSSVLLALALTGNLLVSVALGLFDLELGIALLQSMAAVLLMGGYVWGLLRLWGKSGRFVQTLTAAYACDALISCAAMTLLLAAHLLPEWVALLGIPLLVVTMWQMAVFAHVLRRGLSIGLAGGAGLSLAYTAFVIRLMMLLFPHSV